MGERLTATVGLRWHPWAAWWGPARVGFIVGPLHFNYERTRRG